MRLIKKYGRILPVVLVMLLLYAPVVYAAGNMAAVETYTGESEIVLYVKGVKEELSDIHVQVGTNVCESVAQSKLSETGQPVKTLILLDNSLSVEKANRKRISKLIRSIIAGRMENEEMSLAIFNEGIVYLSDYTSNETELLETVDEINYQRTQTYLTDVLYELLTSEEVQAAEDAFYRIVLISDGMDSKSIGYTKEELSELLKEHPIPVYTVGIQTGKKNNNEQLENMFAISRLTGADSFLMNKRNALIDITQALDEDRNIIRIAVRLPDELMDGGKKAVKLTFDSGEDLSTEMIMPQPLKAVSAKDLGHTQIDGTEPGGRQFVFSQRQAKIVVCAGLLVLAAIGGITAVFRKKKKGNGQKDEWERYSDSGQVKSEGQGQAAADGFETEWMYDEGESATETEIEGNMETMYHIILTDIQSPARSFQVPIRGCVIVGRAKGECDLVLDFDRSVSGKHCKIEVRENQFYVTDLNSTNGTYIEGHKISSETEIFSGNILKMGRVACRFEVVFEQEE